MSNLGDLYLEKYETDMARIMYTRAISGFATVQGPSSSICRKLERKLAASDLSPSEVDIHEIVSKKPVKGKSVSTIRKLFGKFRT